MKLRADIRSRALDLAESKGLDYSDPDSPRTSVRRLAGDLGVDRLELRKMEDTALFLEREKGRYTLFLNSSHPKPRHRFSIAHEVSHLLVAPIIGHTAVHRKRFSPGQDDYGRQIEFLCDDMASAILMPQERLEALLSRTGLTAGCVPKTVNDFGVSFEAAARRYISVLSQPCALVKWTLRGGLRKEERPISNFGLGWLKFQSKGASPQGSKYYNDTVMSKEHVVVHPSRYSRMAPIHVKDATVETLRHGRGQYQLMYSFVYIPGQVAGALKAKPRIRSSRG